MLLIVGLSVVVLAVGGGYLMAGGSLLVLMQPSEFVVIGGAAIGSLLVSTPKEVLLNTVAQIKTTMGAGTACAFSQAWRIQTAVARASSAGGRGAALRGCGASSSSGSASA